MTRWRALTLGVALVLVLGVPVAAPGGEITVLCPRVMQQVIAAAAADFQRSARHDVWLSYGAGDAIDQRARTETADIVITSVVGVAQLEASGAVRPGTRAMLGRVALGVAVPAGSVAPEISTPAALRRALLQATTLGYVDPGRDPGVGGHVVRILEDIGIALLVRPKTTLFPDGTSALDRVARGQVALAIAPISEIRGAGGVRLAGPLPQAIQRPVDYAAAVLTRSAAPDVASAFLAHLRTTEMRVRLKAGGVDVD
jgi:molybdate transport system substrate-binding protein